MKIDILFDGGFGTGLTFVEVEDHETHRSVGVGTWSERDGYQVLTFEILEEVEPTEPPRGRRKTDAEVETRREKENAEALADLIAEAVDDARP